MNTVSTDDRVNRQNKVFVALFFLVFFLYGPVIGLVRKAVNSEEYRTYSSTQLEYDAYFPDTFEISLPSHWSDTGYGHGGFRNQKYRRASFTDPGGLNRFRSSHRIDINWREKQAGMTDVSSWLWTDIAIKDYLSNAKEGKTITIGPYAYPAVRYDFDRWIALLITSDSGDYAVLIYSPKKLMAEQLLSKIESSFVINPDG